MPTPQRLATLAAAAIALAACTTAAPEEHGSTHAALEEGDVEAPVGDGDADAESRDEAPSEKAGWFEGSCRAEPAYDFDKDRPYCEIVSSSCGWGWGEGIVSGDPSVECFCRCK